MFVANPTLSHRFTGKERDDETGLDYFLARYLSSPMGRFTSADAPFADQHASDPQSWNLYTYVRNNPLRYVDPTGRCSRDAQGGYWDRDDAGTYMFAGPCADGEITSEEDVLLSPMAQAFSAEMNRRAGASMQMIGTVIVGSTAVGVAGGLAIHAGGAAGLQQLSVAAGPAAYSALPQIGRKLDYLFGLARGSVHNVQRSTSMLGELQRVGLNDTAQARNHVRAHLGRVLNDASSIVSQTGNRTVRESFLMGPTGGIKLETVWEGTKLITMKVLGGGQ
jgi:RHS repeat-associated protein